jgi:hypothetical protein
MPRKEINFFSRDRNWTRGFQWYEGVFAECPPGSIAGEFSTSYLTDSETPARIRDRYPEVQLIVSLRHPVDRAHSSYLNDIVAGVVPPEMGFLEALQSHPEYLDGGRYARFLRNYLDLFPRNQLLVLMFDDARRDPLGAIQGILRFLGVDPAFRPTMLDRQVGAGRVPRSQGAERSLLGVSAAFRHRRSLRPGRVPDGLDSEERRALVREFEPDIRAIEDLLRTELPGWRR